MNTYRLTLVSDELDEKADRLGLDEDETASVGAVSAEQLIDPEALKPYDFDNLPPHACAYCGVHDPAAVVKCMHGDCNKWFCNGKGLSEYGSHIVLHMVKSKHKEISLHPKSDLKDANLECHSCKGTNVFLLGFMPAKTEAYVIILCREPCLRQLSVKESVYDTDNWMPLIENKALLSWLVRPPTEVEHMRSRQIKP